MKHISSLLVNENLSAYEASLVIYSPAISSFVQFTRVGVLVSGTLTLYGLVSVRLD